jgi:protein-S-isoprenylcysteine O-methyltransferase Ste14
MAVSATIGVVLAMAFHLASRLGYVFGVGAALRRQDRDQVFTRYDGVKTGFDRFRRGASWIMACDAVSFILLALVTRDTLHAGIPRAVLIAIGAVLIIVGIVVKLWARARLGADAYYWYNFFTGADDGPLDPPGPYRYLSNPMYTVGYLQMYGCALVLASLPALLFSVFDQAAILVFHRFVERPHYERLVARRG